MDNKRNTDLRDVDYYLFSAEITKDKISSLRKDQLMYIIIALIIGFLTYISNAITLALVLGSIIFIILLITMIKREKNIYIYKELLLSQIKQAEEKIDLITPYYLNYEEPILKARLKILKDN